MQNGALILAHFLVIKFGFWIARQRIYYGLKKYFCGSYPKLNHALETIFCFFFWFLFMLVCIIYLNNSIDCLYCAQMYVLGIFIYLNSTNIYTRSFFSKKNCISRVPISRMVHLRIFCGYELSRIVKNWVFFKVSVSSKIEKSSKIFLTQFLFVFLFICYKGGKFLEIWVFSFFFHGY